MYYPVNSPSVSRNSNNIGSHVFLQEAAGHYDNFINSIPELHHQNILFSIIPTTTAATQVATVPLPFSCSFCNDNVVANLSNSTIQVPVKVNLPMRLPRMRIPLENELLSRSPPSQGYLPPLIRSGRRIKTRDRSNLTNVPGLSKWFLKRRTDQLLASSISKNKLQRTQKVLKRLNNANFRYGWKMERRYNFERESIRESRLEMLRRKGIKAPCKNECALWNCPRKEYKRKRPFMPLDLEARSVSRLSNLSMKSRSPIVFHRSP